MTIAHVRAEPAIITRSGIAADFAIAIPPGPNASGRHIAGKCVLGVSVFGVRALLPATLDCAPDCRNSTKLFGCAYSNPQALSSTIHLKELNMTSLQGWIVIGLLVLIVLGIIGIGAEMEGLPWIWRTYNP